MTTRSVLSHLGVFGLGIGVCMAGTDLIEHGHLSNLAAAGLALSAVMVFIAGRASA